MRLINKNKKISILFSLENEIGVDDHLFLKMGLSEGSLIFKALRFSDRINEKYIVFIVFLIPLYFVFLCLFVILRKFKNLKKIDYEYANEIFLSFSSSPKVKFIKENHLNNLIFIECVSGRELYFSNNISFFCILKNFIFSIYLYVSLLLDSKFKFKYILHLTSLYELALFYDYLLFLKQKNVRSLYLVNHYDRWITMIGQSGLFKLHVVQHGILNEKFYVKNKIDNVYEIKCFNKNQEIIFLNNVVKNPPKKMEYIGSKLNIINDDCCDILIISSPFYIKYEINIYLKLSGKYKVFFRPHPLFITSDIIDNIIDSDLCLGERMPNPKICICRESTLGLEYESQGCNILWWDEHTNFENFNF